MIAKREQIFDDVIFDDNNILDIIENYELLKFKLIYISRFSYSIFKNYFEN